MNKNEFNNILRLTLNQPWLTDKSESLYYLLYQECDTDEKRELIFNLINRFKYISPIDYSNLTKEFVSKIINTPHVSDNNSQFVAMTFDSGTDSGQHVLYNMKSILEGRGWRDHVFVNRTDRSLKEFNKRDKLHKNIFLIDEIIGSGKTAKGRVDYLLKQYNSEEIKIRVRCIAASSIGLKYLNENNIDVDCVIELERGISDFFTETEIADKINIMLLLESNLSKNYKSRTMPSLGYGEAEMLYVREDGNTPNSVFPIFWWPLLSNFSPREVILHRAMGDA